MQKIKLHIVVFILSLLCIHAPVCAAEPELPQVQAKAFVLMEPESGNILYSKNENERCYPASMTKILTAILAAEYIAPDEIIVAGTEVNAIPYDSSRAYHEVGEAITGENILRGLIIPSGNETGCIVAVAIAKKVLEVDTVTYAKAEKTFSDLMNKKAKELGALNSNFVNPHGYHNENHYTTPYDMALIVREAMKNDLIMEIAMETMYDGVSASGVLPSGSFPVQHKWPSHNKLVMPQDPYYYQYATGLKTGWMDQAGECLAATASKNGVSLISVTFDSPVINEVPTRWTDNRNLFEYGFNNFSTETIVSEGDILGEIPIDNPRLGESAELSFISVDTVTDFLSKSKLEAITREIVFDPLLIADAAPDEELPEIRLKAPIAKGDVIGTVAYTLDGRLVFLGNIIASADVLTRTFNSDVDYYIAEAKAVLFSKAALPYWIIAGLVIIILLLLAFIIQSRRKKGGRRFIW